MAAIRRPFKDPNHLALQELGWQFHSGLFQGPFSEVINSFNQLTRHQVFQYSLDNSIVPCRHQSINLFESIHISQYTPAGKLSTKLQSVQQVFKEELVTAIKSFKKYADTKIAILPDLQPGDKVWLAFKSIKTTRPTKKLSEIYLGPFEVLKNICSHAYHLKLPQQWNSVHPVFHVSLLEPVNQSTIPNQHQFPPLPVIVEEQEEWEVAWLLD
ncbi:hypothetical protein O181_071849 [Austropuccinia psidii MF-1]|uniref:Tf2-1-like SH3-like domain-containing protein n=1 Tax=Austropuccinia psidii MF-1 TaxID=1389203 RepID=A0A9Q3IAW7_9BASI|nr:hypothetical protein [Austropuccinia psidii MF-1]